MRFARADKTVYMGKTYDLMYVNPHSDSFNPDRQYAFLRRSGRQLLIVVANFEDNERDIELLIPSHAFEWLKIHTIEAEGYDVLTDEKVKVFFSPDQKIKMHVPANGAAIWKFKTV